MPVSTRKRQGSGPEFEVAPATRELGKTLQREMLQKQSARLSDNGQHASHGEDAAPQVEAALPQEDRAG
jgi:hypothetical protein